VVLLDEFDDLFVLVGLLGSLGEVEVAACACFFGLHDCAHWGVEVLSFGEGFVGLGVA
jgi:hypothetical protein